MLGSAERVSPLPPYPIAKISNRFLTDSPSIFLKSNVLKNAFR